MKAKLYAFGTELEVRVGNKSYVSLEKETKKEFLVRVQGLLEKDFDEVFEIVEVTSKQLEKLDDTMILEAYKVSRGLQEKILVDIMVGRGLEFSKVERVSKVRVQPRTKEEAQASQMYKDAKANVGKLVSYSPTAKKAVEGEEEATEEVSYTGVIKSVSMNKSNTIIYYNVQCGTNLRCCTATNKTLQFFEI